jgi:FHS family glucose/mannose:H+ symporter-like MFS transporter
VNRASTVGVLVLGAAAGLLLSLYGPAIPRLREAYGVGGGGSALVLSAHFAGAMTGIGWWGLEGRLAARTWLRVATALLVTGAVAIVSAPAWPVVLLAAFAIGVGFGVVVVEINVLLTEGFGDRAAAMLNLLGACFGAGAVVGPLAIAATGGYRLPFCAGALLAVVAMALTRDLPATAPAPPERGRDGPPPGLVGGFVALLLLYVGVESGVGGFEATSLRAAGTGAAAAASWTAGYWAAITTGRLLAIPLALRLAAPVLVAGSLLVAAAGLGLAHLPAVAPVAYTLTGLALGPVFPTMLAWLAAAAGGRGPTALVFAAANLGGVVVPLVIGQLVDASSPAVVPTSVLVVVLACLSATLLLRRSAAPVP